MSHSKICIWGLLGCCQSCWNTSYKTRGVCQVWELAPNLPRRIKPSNPICVLLRQRWWKKSINVVPLLVASMRVPCWSLANLHRISWDLGSLQISKKRHVDLMVLPSLKLTANAPENGWLEVEMSYWEGLFSRDMLVSQRVTLYELNLVSSWWSQFCPVKISTGWWFWICFFSSLPGEMIQFD